MSESQPPEEPHEEPVSRPDVSTPQPPEAGAPPDPPDLTIPSHVKAWYPILMSKCDGLRVRYNLRWSEAAEDYHAVWLKLLDHNRYDGKRPFWPYFKAAYLHHLWKKIGKESGHVLVDDLVLIDPQSANSWRTTYEWYCWCTWNHLTPRQRSVVTMYLLLPTMPPPGVQASPYDLMAEEFIADWDKQHTDNALPQWVDVGEALKTKAGNCRVIYLRAREHLQMCWKAVNP